MYLANPLPAPFGHGFHGTSLSKADSEAGRGAGGCGDAAWAAGLAAHGETLRGTMARHAANAGPEPNGCILPESACPRPGQLPQGLGASRPFGTLRLREMAQAHFEEVVVKAIDAHWFDEASWTLAESQELFHFLAALEYPLGLDSCTTLEVLRAWSRKGGIVAVENLVLGGTWHPNGWNGIEGCRFIPEPSLSLEDLQSMAVDSDRARACELWEQMMA
eukprot:s23_g2.t1